MYNYRQFLTRAHLKSLARRTRNGLYSLYPVQIPYSPTGFYITATLRERIFLSSDTNHYILSIRHDPRAGILRALLINVLNL